MPRTTRTPTRTPRPSIKNLGDLVFTDVSESRGISRPTYEPLSWGAARRIDRLVLRWPGGRDTVYRDLAVGQVLVVPEPEPAQVP